MAFGCLQTRYVRIKYRKIPATDRKQNPVHERQF